MCLKSNDFNHCIFQYSSISIGSDLETQYEQKQHTPPTSHSGIHWRWKHNTFCDFISENWNCSMESIANEFHSSCSWTVYAGVDY